MKIFNQEITKNDLKGLALAYASIPISILCLNLQFSTGLIIKNVEVIKYSTYLMMGLYLFAGGLAIYLVYSIE
jgi:hypothetical protein